VIASASLAFVGNIDLSIEQVVNSLEYDLFTPLPKEFDLAVMDRFACYLPGWEMPKNSSTFLTSNYGLITDFLAEAFHYQFSKTSRYEEVSKRIRLGPAAEGRDEKGIKKTVCALLKILHPDGPPSDSEFEDYVAYAVECRRRVKEQMNKRKPDDEFARINLSYYRPDGTEVTVYCPESKNSIATQNPVRRESMGRSGGTSEPSPTVVVPPSEPAPPATAMAITLPPSFPASVANAPVTALVEQHYTIRYGDVGHSYDSIVGPYLAGAKEVVVEDPYIRMTHQVQNLVRFCEAVVKAGSVKKIKLITGYDDEARMAEVQEKILELQQSLADSDVVLEVAFNTTIHDREIRIDNGWVVKIGRGLDFYQKPGSWYEIGATDLSMRKCLETKVDIFRTEAAKA
jgi:ATP-dependent Lon protease